MELEKLLASLHAFLGISIFQQFQQCIGRIGKNAIIGLA